MTTLSETLTYGAHDLCTVTACLSPLHPGPCKGWRGTPEEAFQRVHRQAKKGIGAYHTPKAAKGAPRSHLTALKNYVDGSGPINRSLRHSKGGGSNDAMVVADIKAMDKVMAGAKLAKPIQVMRAVSPSAFGGRDTNVDLTGAEYSDHAFGSTGTDLGLILKHFSETSSGKRPLIANIVVPAGMSAVRMPSGQFGDEKEILLDRGAHYRVVHDHGFINTPKGKFRHVTLEVVPGVKPQAQVVDLPEDKRQTHRGRASQTASADVLCACLSPVHPGPCKVAVPDAPKPETSGEKLKDTVNANDAASRAAALQHAAILAQVRTLPPAVQTSLNGVLAKYEQQIKIYKSATARIATLRAKQQAAHDNAIKKNIQIDKLDAIAAQRAAAVAATKHARQIRAQARGHHAAKTPATPAKAKFALLAAGYDEDIPSPQYMFDALVAAFAATWINDDWDPEHDLCSLTACRTPLHPGPCKGWKHTLFKTAPGVFHTLEQQRVDQANKKRLAKIAELEAAGKKVPASLKKPITYGHPAPPPGHLPNTTAPVGQTAKEVVGEAHVAMQKANAPVVAQKAAVGAPGKVTLGEAIKKAPVRPAPAKTGGPAAKAQPTPGHREPVKALPPKKVPGRAEPAGKAAAKAMPTPGHREPVKKATEDLPGVKQGKAVFQIGKALGSGYTDEGKVVDKISSLGWGHPTMKKLVMDLSSMAQAQAVKFKVDEPGISEINKQIGEHIQHGKPGLPSIVQDIVDAKAKAEKAKVGAPEVPPTEAPKAKVPQEAHLSIPEVKNRIHQAYLEVIKDDPKYKWVMLSNIRSHPLLKDVPREQVDAALQDMLKNHHEHFNIIPESNQKVLTQEQRDASIKIGNQPQHLISIGEGFTIPGLTPKAETPQAPKVPEPNVPSLAFDHIQQAKAVASGKHPSAHLSKTQVAVYGKLSKEEFDTLPANTKDKIEIDLKKAHGKFLDPKKKEAAAELLAKFGRPLGAKPGEPKGETPQPKTYTHIGPAQHDMNVTPAHAQELVNKAEKYDISAVAAKAAGLHPTDHPSSGHHLAYAGQQAEKELIGLIGGHVGAINDPEVKAALKEFTAAAIKFHKASSASKGAEASFVKIGQAKTKGSLSPVQLAALNTHLANVMKHPDVHGEQELHQLKLDMSAKGTELLGAIDKAEKAAAEPKMTLNEVNAKVAHMQPHELNAIVDNAIGFKALKPTMPTGVEFTQAADDSISEAIHADMLPDHILNDPAVKARRTNALMAEREVQKLQMRIDALQEHLTVYHDAFLHSGLNEHGQELTPLQRAAILEHSKRLRTEFEPTEAQITVKKKFANDALQLLKDEINSVAKKPAPGPIAPPSMADIAQQFVLTPKDKEIIGDSYKGAWVAEAQKALKYGTASDYYKKKALFGHPLKDTAKWQSAAVADAAHDLAIAHAAVHQAKLAEEALGKPPSIPGQLDPPELAAINLKTAEQQFKSKLADLQATIDTMRVSAGLTKKKLPAFSSAAVKTEAAEKAYYKASAYDNPDKKMVDVEKYGGGTYKTVDVEWAKNFLVNKVGEKLAQAHKDSYEKQAEKAAAKNAAAQAKLAKVNPDYVAKKAALGTKKHYLINGTKGELNDAGYPKPNAALAAEHNFHYAANVGAKTSTGSNAYGLSGDAAQSGKHAYLADPAEYEKWTAAVTNPDTTVGKESQQQFPWSISSLSTAYPANDADAEKKHGWAKALNSYTGSGSESINEALNKAAPGVPVTNAAVKKIDAAMQAAPPLEHDVVLWRGFGNAQNVFSAGKWNETNVAGMEWTQRSYSSTSAQQSTAQSFSGSSGVNSVTMRILVPKSMKIKGISASGGQHEGENEIILQRGIRYRVVADYGVINNSRRLDVEVVPNPYG